MGRPAMKMSSACGMHSAGSDVTSATLVRSSVCGMYSRSSFTKPMSSLFHASGLRVRIDTVCPASAASAAKMGVELPPPTTVMYMAAKGWTVGLVEPASW